MIFFALIGLLTIAVVLAAAAASLFLRRPGGRHSMTGTVEGTPPL
ncbi:MAG TPA: hypothetical protein VID75_02470 [Acidimicrobiales bacterium]